MEKLISVIVPCYNVEKYIDRCFRSIAAQTIGIERLEIILVDDCSTDATWERLVALEAEYPDSVIVIRCDENGRQGRARNIGMEYASAPYIGFVDADDWIEPNMYEKLYDKIYKNQCEIAMCQSWRDSGRADQELPLCRTGQDDRILYIDTADKRKMFLVCGSIGYSVWNKLYKTELLRKNEIYFPEYLVYEDHFFSTLLYFYAHKVYILEERLYHYFINEQSTVLMSGAEHHFDILTVNSLLWDECERRGLLHSFRKEMEYLFLSLCYLTSFKMQLLRLSGLSYDYFLRLKEETLKRIPNYHDNPYVKELVTDLNKVILELVDIDISEDQLNELGKTLGTYVRKGILKI